ncbi:hypothetical protein [Okeania sp.]|uniref:hypothetical protein n=1 Tax=Okeania sp. TaxID=3100323 RepID=UPI002B4AB47F|nr:hypothetical protein [Okeania sp.]MEB3341436.1 hypothetical protein [Okeania sp.]
MTPIIFVEPKLAQTSPTPNLPKAEYIWMGTSGLMLVLLIILGIFHKVKIKQFHKKISVEEFRNKDLYKKYKLAVATIAKMEKNPDLIHSREFNLDYLRMRMAEEVFHFAIVNQIKVKVQQKISVALRPTQVSAGEKGNPSGRQIDSMFEIEYETGEAGKDLKKRVLFRISIKLTKLPTQATSQTINQIIDCLETYLSPSDDHDNWTPTIQGRIVHIDWDQKAKPVPMLVLEQSHDGVLFRTNRPTVKNPTLSSPKPPLHKKNITKGAVGQSGKTHIKDLSKTTKIQR